MRSKAKIVSLLFVVVLILALATLSMLASLATTKVPFAILA